MYARPRLVAEAYRDIPLRMAQCPDSARGLTRRTYPDLDLIIALELPWSVLALLLRVFFQTGDSPALEGRFGLEIGTRNHAHRAEREIEGRLQVNDPSHAESAALDPRLSVHLTQCHSFPLFVVVSCLCVMIVLWDRLARR